MPTNPALPRLLLTLFLFSYTPRQPKAPRESSQAPNEEWEVKMEVLVCLILPPLIFIGGCHGLFRCEMKAEAAWTDIRSQWGAYTWKIRGGGAPDRSADRLGRPSLAQHQPTLLLAGRLVCGPLCPWRVTSLKLIHCFLSWWVVWSMWSHYSHFYWT